MCIVCVYPTVSQLQDPAILAVNGPGEEGWHGCFGQFIARGGSVDCVVGYWLDYLNKYKAYYSRTQSLLATNSSHWGTYLWVTFDSSTTIHQSPGPGTWQYDSLDLICDCFPNINTFLSSIYYSGL